MKRPSELRFIPIVDLSFVPSEIQENCAGYGQFVEKAAKEIVSAMQEIGFVYVQNHGINSKEVAEIFELSQEFFALETEIKSKYNRGQCGHIEHGYVHIGLEKLDPLWRYDEIRESFNITGNEGLPFPTEIEEFPDKLREFYVTSTKLASRLLTLIGIGLKLEDPFFLNKCHNEMTRNDNGTTLRLLHYPPVVQNNSVIRCGEHSDYGSITLLFQDTVGGLQVRHRGGSYVDASPIEGCVLVNVGDLLERWTADRLVSTKHRVLVPNCESMQKKDRYSIALFVHPDNSTKVECLDGSQKYPPVTAEDYLVQRLQETYTTHNS